MQFKTSDGLSLHVEDAGSGKVLLCLPGLTRNTRDFDFVAPHLGDYRVIRMDYRGRGQSERDPEFANYNVVREARDVVELLDHLGIGKACVLGTSRGGWWRWRWRRCSATGWAVRC
ncbi:alpha/beta fold hydrolase [Seohaeicola zhoushanensis]